MRTGEFVTGIFLLTIIYMLVRPNSPAATAIKSVSDALVQIVTYATGGASAGAGPI